ncbi:MAG: response regulator [Planctomycetota bacterium]
MDDEPQVRELTLRALAAAGLACDDAENGAIALEKLRANPFDAVLTDLRMPERHGHALCNDLLAQPTPPQVMVLTALTDARLVRDLMGRGVYDVLQKPVRYDVLAQKVVAMLKCARPRTAPAPAAKPVAAKPAAMKTNFLKKVETTLQELTELFGERLDDVFDDYVELPDPPKAVREFIRRLAEAEASMPDQNGGLIPTHEARRKERATCFTTAVAVPVDRHWNRVCEPFKLAIRDVSESGLRMLHTRATNAKFVALTWRATQLPSMQFRVVCKVMRCQPCSPFYDIGGMFVMAD